MEEKKLHHFQCTVCGYVYETEEEELPEEDKPQIVDDYVAPEEEGVEEEELPEEDKPVIVDDYVVPEEEGIEEDELPPEEVVDAEESEEEEIEEVSEAEEEETEDFESIVLVPSEENPPEPEAVESEEESVEAEEIAVEETVEETVEEIAEEVKPAPAVNVPVESKEFEKGKYYIQIAVYSKPENVQDTVNKYGKKYPIIVEKKNGKNYVCVGPLSMDEYGAVLQRFRAFGFKDAFLRKIN